MTTRARLAAALALTEQAIVALETDAPEAVERVEAALAAVEAVASLQPEGFGTEELAALRALAERVYAVGAELKTAMHATRLQLEQLRGRQRASSYGRARDASRGVPSQG